MAKSGMLGDHPCGMMFRVLGIVMLSKSWKIDRCENVRVDRVPVNDLTIDKCSEVSCYTNFRMIKNDIQSLFISLNFPAVMKLDDGSIISSEKASLFYLHRRAFPSRLVAQEIHDFP